MSCSWTIEESAVNMERTLKNLLDFARLENGLMNLKKIGVI